MKQILIFLIIIMTILTASEINCEKKDHDKAEKFFVRQRSFGNHHKYRLDELKFKAYPQIYNFYDLFQKIFKVIDDKETQRKNEEHNKRRKIFQKYLSQFQDGSSFLRDFHTIRF